MRTVAIVGFSERTFKFLKDAHPDEIWTMNHAVFCADFPRIDRLFELHHRDWYLRAEASKSKIYDDWLREKHTFPIYMQEEELNPELIPSGVRYPLEEICEALLPGLIKIIGGEETKLKYFTSSYAFMAALAIYEGFDRIELYGIDMDSNTEYGYQKACGEFWNGLALGKGIQVVIQEPCNLHTSPLYGYDIVPYIDQANVREVVKLYQEKRKERKQAMDVAVKFLQENPEDDGLIQDYLAASGWVYLHDGAINAAARLLEESDSYISRQFLEIKRVEWINGLEYWKAIVNTVKGKMDTDNGPIQEKDWKTYLDARASMYANLGAAQLHNRLMHIIDFRPVNYDLTMDIVEEA